MSDWRCRYCGKLFRGRARAPAYCPGCGLSVFEERPIKDPAAPPDESTASAQPPAGTGKPAAPPAPELRRTWPSPRGPAAVPHRERRHAKRVQPHSPLEVRLASHSPLPVADISATGFLVEHDRPFTLKMNYEGELRRSDRTIRIACQVVRSSVTPADGPRGRGIRYRTGLQFLVPAPTGLFTLVPELSEFS